MIGSPGAIPPGLSVTAWPTAQVALVPGMWAVTSLASKNPASVVAPSAADQVDPLKWAYRVDDGFRPASAPAHCGWPAAFWEIEWSWLATPAGVLSNVQVTPFQCAMYAA